MVEDVDVDNVVVFDNFLVDDDHVCSHLVDIHFKFVILRIVDLDNDFVFVDTLVVCFVDIFVVVVEIDQFVDLVDLVDCSFVDFCCDSFFVDILVLVDILVVALVLVDILVVALVHVDLVDFDCNIDFDDVVFDSIDFGHIVVVVDHIVVDSVGIVVVEHIAVERIVVAVVVGHNS